MRAMRPDQISQHKKRRPSYKYHRGPLCFFCSNAEGKWNLEEPWECAVGYVRKRYKECIHFDPRIEAMNGLREYFPEIWSRYSDIATIDDKEGEA